MGKIVSGALGALAMYLFDPQMGRTRRTRLQSRIGGIARRGARDAARKVAYARGQAEGLRHMNSSHLPPPNDAALTAKVESEVLRRSRYPRSSIRVNSCAGVVELRGVCHSPDEMLNLERDVRKVTGVIDVHNYLHLPNTPAPNKEPALSAGR